MDFNEIKNRIDAIGANAITISYIETNEENDELFDVFVNVWPNKNVKKSFETIVVKTETSLEKAENISQRLSNSLGRYYKNVKYTGHEA
ncbi:hypothetical protein SAMN04487936_11183 [Halobacillus dabanensis]|uniref:Uncharacterized protein n=1 Tax=Halobacillus dabanensis TaxID=240302 RepID=A0A1I3YPB5_HALDA|nr:hypothetical protein [Halobacillus dabanensis]SFK33056.1 hypothetical protein SAMN04487936_11183 [Halobacillus dabanensis]